MESPSKKSRSSPPLSTCAHAPLKAWLASLSEACTRAELGLDHVLVRADPHGGVGLFAAQPIAPGAVAFMVPRAAVVSPQVVNADPTVGLGGALAAYPYPFRAALWLARARHDRTHAFHAFARALPAAAPNAPWWPAPSRAWLRGSNLGFACDAARASLAAQWAAAGSQAALAAQPHSTAALGAASQAVAGLALADVQWGAGVYDSRRLPLRLSGASVGKAASDDYGPATGEGVLVPLLDFGNHHAAAKVRKYTRDGDVSILLACCCCCCCCWWWWWWWWWW